MRLFHRLVVTFGLCVLFLPGCTAAKDVSPDVAQEQEQKAVALDTEDQKIIYALGLALAPMVEQQLGAFDFSPEERELVIAGLSDSLSKKEPRVDMTELGPKLQTYARARMEKVQMAKMTPEQLKAYEDKKAAADQKLAEEKAGSSTFLDKLASEEGAVRESSGLVYRELVAGTGAQPTATSVVKVHYTGKLRDGSTFDSSVDRGTPVEFPLNRVIPCWTEGLQKMKVGGKAMIGCPAAIAYGDGGRPGIPGGAALSFEVELIDIVK